MLRFSICESYQCFVNIRGSSDWLVDLSGNFATAPNDCTDGSPFRRNGMFRIRKAGACVTCENQ